MPGSLRARVATALVVLVTALSALAVGLGLHLEPNVSSLLPDGGDAIALRKYVRAFGGGDLGVVLVHGDDADEDAAAADALAAALASRRSIAFAASRVELPRGIDPMLLFRHADAATRAKLAAALTPEGMRARLADTRRMLLAPGSGALADVVAQDPLRLGQLALEGAGVGAAGGRAQADGSFASDDGKARLVLIKARGQALHGADARAFVDDVEAAIAPIRSAHPKVRFGVTGGHAIAAATEDMLISDLELSGTLSLLLASAAFALVFRRLRALVAVLPPLVLGTLWTAGLATLFPGGVSAIAVAFTSVVVGVGVDTGVHTYAATMAARRRGLEGAACAAAARKAMTSQVMTAAITAGAAFGALALSGIAAVRQLGILCGAGEILTAVSIVIVTPSLGAWLERKAAPPEMPSGWTRAVAWLTATKPRAIVAAIVALAPIPALVIGGPPPLAEAVVAVRPKALEPLRVQQAIFDAFGGKFGQWVVLVADPSLERARERADAIAERLAAMPGDVEAVDSLSRIAPALATQKARYAERDALDLPKKADDLEAALGEVGFAPARFSAALDGMRHATHATLDLADAQKGAGALLTSRFLGRDAGEELVALYVRPSTGKDVAAHVDAAVRAVDPTAAVTGYGRLDASLRATLLHDMPRISGVAAGLVVLALAASLRRLRDVVLAALVITSEICAVLLLIRALGIPLHAYDALVLPVLLGITVDEGMFLIQHARVYEGTPGGLEATLRAEGPSIASTALTTAAGFAALGVCRFDGLRDLGWVGALGSVVGLVVALIVVPAGLKLFSS
ncbi:MAG TPA: MMPL family transporter [Byssovorax sp.]